MAILLSAPILCLFYCLCLHKGVESARLAILPSADVPVGSSAVTLRCSADGAGYSSVYEITIAKENPSSTASQIGTVNPNDITAGSSKYTITGKVAISEPTSSFLQVVINNPVCSDVGTYQCKTNGDVAVGVKTDSKHVTVESDPGPITMTVTPDKYVFGYDVNDNIDIRCGGRVGNPQKFWSWQWKRAGSTFWNSFSNNGDIADSPVRQPTDTDCSYDSSSLLKYVVKADDNGMMIRCQVDNNEAYSANYTIKVKDGETARLRITPTPNVPEGSTAVTIKCFAASAVFSKLYALTILKEIQSVADTTVAHIDGDGLAKSTSRFNITGNLVSSTATPSFIQVVINLPICSDVGIYQCRITGEVSFGVKTDNQNLKIQSEIGNVDITTNPDKIVFNVNEALDIQCGGRVGNPQKYWSWQWKRAGSTFWNSFSNNDDITEGPVRPPTATDCSYDSSSVLKYVVKADDNGMMFRCQVDNNEAYSANYTINVKNVESVGLTIIPPANVPVGSPYFILRCSPAFSTISTKLYALTILKANGPIEDKITLATIDSDGPTTESSPKYNITGYLITSIPTSSFLQVIVNSPGNSDMGIYQCKTTDPVGVKTYNQNVTLQNVVNGGEVVCRSVSMVIGAAVGILAWKLHF